MSSRPGSIVAWWDGGLLTVGVVSAEEKSRVRLVRTNGKEERIRENRLFAEIEAGGEIPDGTHESRRSAGLRARACEAALREEADGIDVELVWGLVAESGDESVAASQLADLALDDTGGRGRTAMTLALLGDGLHFNRKADRWEPRSAERVEELRRERAHVEQRRLETGALHDALRAAVAGRGYTPLETETERRTLHALEETAIHEEQAGEPFQKAARETLQQIGLRHDRLPEGAFRLLRAVGRFDSDDANLQIPRFDLRVDFPDTVLEAARRAAAAPSSTADREDLTDLETLSVDSPSTREIDDALSARRESNGWTVWIHIADPAAFVHPGDPLDVEASARGLTHYFPDRRLTMLPAEICEQAASLAEGEVRPALTFRVHVDSAGEVVSHTLRRSWVRSDRRLSYDTADGLLEGDPDGGLLGCLAGFADAREGCRGRAGALLLRQPDVDVKVDADGTVRLERLGSLSHSRAVVTEAMVLAGQVAARVAAEHRLPIIHRRQPAPADPPEVPAEGLEDPVRLRAVLRCLQRADAGLEAAPHYALGLEAYAQATSPLRRYQDLATHRQLAAAATGGEAPYDEEAMRRIAGATERAETAARQAERACNAYWMLRYLEGQVGETVTATVIDTEPRPIVQLDETRWTQPMPSLAGVEPGELVEIRVERVNPRAGLLVLRRPGQRG